MSALNLERVLPKIRCCVYLRHVRAGRQDFIGTGLAELLGNRRDLPSAEQWAAFESPTLPSESSLLDQDRANSLSVPTTTIDSYRARLRNAAGNWVYVQCLEADTTIHGESVGRVRLGLMLDAERAGEVEPLIGAGGTGWTELARRAPAIIARLDATGALTFANDLAQTILGHIQPEPLNERVSNWALPVDIKHIIDESLSELRATS